QVSSTELTKHFLARLQKHDATLKFVIELLEEPALKQAKRADDEIAANKYRGPLHGIPWGAKDLIGVAGHKFTWGSAHFKEQMATETATVAKRLEDAGAVLVAKLTMGALAYGAPWSGGPATN